MAIYDSTFTESMRCCWPPCFGDVDHLLRRSTAGHMRPGGNVRLEKYAKYQLALFFFLAFGIT